MEDFFIHRKNRGTEMRRRAWVGFALALSALFIAGSAEGQVARQAVTLDEALTRAMEESPVIAQAQGATRSAAAAQQSALGAYLPTVSVSAGSSLSSTERYNPQTNTSVSGSSDSYRSGLSLGWDVYTGGRRGAQSNQAEAGIVSADADLVEQRFNVALQVERAFYDALRAEELAAVALGRIERAEQGLAAAERRLQVGSATQSDVLRGRLELNTAQESLLQAQTQQNNAEFALGRLIGIEGAADPEPIGDITPMPLSVSDEDLLRMLALESPTLIAARAAQITADAAVDVARTQYLPAIRFSTGYDWFNTDPAFAGGRTGWSLGLNLSLPVFDGFRREENLTRARVQEEIANAQLADARRSVSATAQQALGQLRLATERIRLSEQAVEVAQEDLRVQDARYNLGASTILDLLLSQTALSQSETDLVSARYDYQIARAELEALAGREL